MGKQTNQLRSDRTRLSYAKRLWWWFATVFTVVGLIYLALAAAPVPFFEHNSATVMNSSRQAQRATAKAIAAGIGNPIAELHTKTVDRFFFKDGTLVDYAKNADELNLMYSVAALKTIVLGHVSLDNPTDVAERITSVLEGSGYRTQRIYQPDPEFASGDVILILSDAFKVTEDAGFGILVRRTAFRVDGPVPDLFDGSF